MAWNANGANFAKIEFPKLSLIESFIRQRIKFGFISLFVTLCLSHVFSERIRFLVYSPTWGISNLYKLKGEREDKRNRYLFMQFHVWLKFGRKRICFYNFSQLFKFLVHISNFIGLWCEYGCVAVLINCYVPSFVSNLAQKLVILPILVSPFSMNCFVHFLLPYLCSLCFLFIM
jgi:hypothetical protein